MRVSVMRRSAASLGLAWAAGLLITAGAKAAERFDFNTYEYSAVGQDAYGQVPNTEMAARAQAFVSTHYPAGRSARDAVADFRRAGAACHSDHRMTGHTACSYALPSHGMTALIGSAVWRIDVYASGQDQVTSITVSRELAAQ